MNGKVTVAKDVMPVSAANAISRTTTRPARVPTVLTQEEARQIIAVMTGTPQLVVKLIYGSGLRLLEALRLRVHDLDFAMKQLTVRDGKGAKDCYTLLPDAVGRTPTLPR